MAPKIGVKEAIALGQRVGRSKRTIFRWIQQGMDPGDEESVQRFVMANELKKTNIRRQYERVSRIANGTGGNGRHRNDDGVFSGELDIGKEGAAAALTRLERSEAEGYARLQKAIATGDLVLIRELQDGWLKCSEILRKLDLAVELARRDEQELVPKKTAEEVALFAAEWLRISFMQFLSAEGPTLMGIKQFGEWKKYAVERFKGILELTVKSSLQTKSPIPDWASDRIKEAWNVS